MRRRSKKRIPIGLIGLGTVGSGVVKLLQQNRDLLERRLGASIEVKKIAVTNIKKERTVDVDRSRLTSRAEEVIDDPEIAIVVELMGGIDPARRYLVRTIENGKQVVTANKALLAHHGSELFAEAEKRGVAIGFEASVCGGIPIIRTLQEGFVGDQIVALYGIINGTANYILSRMTYEGGRFKEVLKEAQARGYAEADPRLDINGIDSAHKLVLLIRSAFGADVDVASIDTEGIERVRAIDVRYADEFGYRIKLLAIAKLEGGRIEARVHPTLLPKETLLATVDGVFNAVYVVGEASGPGLYFGSGAGMMPTASAVMSDIIEISRDLLSGASFRVPSRLSPERAIVRREIQPAGEIQSRYYLRFMAVDRPGVLANIAGILGERGIGIASVIQKGRKIERGVPVVIMTYEAKGSAVEGALSQIDRLPVVTEKSLAIRIESDLS